MGTINYSTEERSFYDRFDYINPIICGGGQALPDGAASRRELASVARVRTHPSGGSRFAGRPFGANFGTKFRPCKGTVPCPNLYGGFYMRNLSFLIFNRWMIKDFGLKFWFRYSTGIAREGIDFDICD